MENKNITTLYDKLNEEDSRDIHIRVSERLKEIHEDGKYIPVLDSRKIFFGSFFDKEVIDAEKVPFESEEQKKYAVEQNKEFLATIILFGSLGILDKISLGTVNMIKSDLENYLDIATVDEDDKDYYRSIFIEDGKPYYHEYINNKKNVVSNDGASDNLGISKTKSTAYSGLGGVEYDNNKVSHGNATWYILAALTVMFSVTAVILFIMSGK